MRLVHQLLVLALTVALLHPASAQPQKFGVYSAKTGLSWPLLKRGAKNENVRVAQMLLRARGYRVTADGRLGAATEKALRRFQSQKRLQSDGILGTRTWQALVVSLQKGARGEAVRALQLLLSQNNHRVAQDSRFGAATRLAILAFQREQGLNVTGTADVNTWGALLGAEAAYGD